MTRLRSTVVDPLSSEVELDAEDLPAELVEWVRSKPDSFNYQYVLAVEPATAGAAVPRPELETADVLPEMSEAEERGVALLLEKRALVEEITALRRKVLTMRDHAIGAEAELGTARREQAIMARKLAKAEHDVAELPVVGQLAGRSARRLAAEPGAAHDPRKRVTVVVSKAGGGVSGETMGSTRTVKDPRKVRGGRPPRRSSRS